MQYELNIYQPNQSSSILFLILLHYFKYDAQLAYLFLKNSFNFDIFCLY